MKKHEKLLAAALGVGALVASVIPLHDAVATSSPVSDAFSFTVGTDGDLLAGGAGAELELSADCELGQRVRYINSRMLQVTFNGVITSSNVYVDQPGIDCNGETQQYPLAFVANSLAFSEGPALVNSFVTVCTTNPDPYYAQFYWYDIDCIEYIELQVVTLAEPSAPPVVITPYGAVVVEGDAGSTTAEVIVRLDTAASAPVTVEFETVGDSGQSGVAEAGVDMEATSGIATFPPGQTEITVPIEVFGDTDVEAPLLYGEWGLVKFSNPSPNAVLDTSTFFGHGLIIIVDDDVDSGNA